MLVIPRENEEKRKIYHVKLATTKSQEYIPKSSRFFTWQAMILSTFHKFICNLGAQTFEGEESG